MLDVPQCWGYWALGNGGIYALDAEKKPRPTIELFSRAGRPPLTVATLIGGPACGESGLAASPDGRSILYVDTERSRDLMLIDGFR